MSSSSGGLLVLSGPSGAGKTTLARRLGEAGLRRVMTTTTRAPRAGEVDGRDYRFLAPDPFRAAIARGEFLEHVEIDGHLYGTPREEIHRELAEGHVVVLDVDPQGARRVRELGLPALLVFVAPPDLAQLRSRLEGRGSESPQAVQARMKRAEGEMAQQDQYDIVVVNHTVEAAAAEILAQARRRGFLR